MRGGHFYFFFLLSLLSEGKMDWGLLLHCAALTFTLARALRSGECHGSLGSRGCGSGGRALGPGPWDRHRHQPGCGTFFRRRDAAESSPEDCPP